MTSPAPEPRPATRRPRKKSATYDFLRLLLGPPRDSDVLIGDEQVFYKAPQHVMSLTDPALETLAVLIVVTTTLARPRYDGVSLGLLALVLSGIVLWRWIQRREWGWSALTWAVIALYVIATKNIDYLIVVPAIGLWFIARFGIRILRWWRYEIRYLTNRRIIEARGFLGLTVASMPVSRVTDLVLTRTAAGELFGYGDLRIESAGQDQSLANVPYLVEPRAFHKLAVRLATKPAKVDLKDFIDVRPIRQIEKR